MTYSDTGKLSPETQSAIEQEIRILLRVIIFFLMFVYLFSQNVPENFGACKIAKVPLFFRNVTISHKVNRGMIATRSTIGTLSIRWQAYFGIMCYVRFKCSSMTVQSYLSLCNPMDLPVSSVHGILQA